MLVPVRGNTSQPLAARQVELPDSLHHQILLFICQFRKHRQGQNLLAGLLGHGHLPRLIAQVLERFLQVQAQRIIDFAQYSFPTEKRFQLVASLGPNRELIKNMLKRIRRSLRRAGIS